MSASGGPALDVNVNVGSTLFLALLLGNLVPLNDLGPAPYDYGYVGGLYEDGSNIIPSDHLAAGLRRAALVTPRDANGNPSPSGKIVFLAVGFGETERIGDAFARTTHLDQQSLVFINAAREGFDSAVWIAPQSATNFNRIRDSLLLPAGVTEKQIQVAWVQMVTNFPFRPLPPADGDAYRLKGAIAAALRELKTRYPNLQIAYLSSRVYGGYAGTGWNPEPFAYETALSNRWVILGQITLMRTGSLWDTRIGPIDYEKNQAPWVAWGPYFWANGRNPRSDGLTWLPEDFEFDGERLSERGAQKAAAMLLQFLLHEPTAAGWFHAAPLRGRAARH
jgi:hypothetical protein